MGGTPEKADKNDTSHMFRDAGTRGLRLGMQKHDTGLAVVATSWALVAEFHRWAAGPMRRILQAAGVGAERIGRRLRCRYRDECLLSTRTGDDCQTQTQTQTHTHMQCDVNVEPAGMACGR